MTTLNVVLNDQTLIAAEKVKLASGDIDSVFLNVEFDAAWNEFPNRTASFFTSRNATPHEVLLIDNECTIPAEVLAKSCTLYVGIIGVSADGTAVKTSSNVSFKIAQGANHSHTTVAPELDMYQQYLAAMMKAVSPAQEVLFARLEERIAQHEVEIAEEYARFKGALVEMVRPVTVWENEEFNDYKWYDQSSTVTVNVDLSNYSSFLVVFYEKGYHGTSGTFYPEGSLVGSPMIVEKGITYSMKLMGSNNNFITREFTLTDEGAVFEPASLAYRIIPAKIIGFGC